MNSTLFEDFEERSQEVRKYFLFLKNLEHGSIRLHIVNSRTTTIDNDLAKTLKATAFLLLYNLIESTITNAIQAIFDELKIKGISFDDLRNELKEIIIKNLKNRASDKLLVSLQRISVDIISASFDKSDLFSGNIDAKKIKKEIAPQYRFSYYTNNNKTYGGIDLKRIKDNRNDLAHGFKSFEDIGKDYTADELLKMQKRVILYLKTLLENIETYLNNEEYLKS